MINAYDIKSLELKHFESESASIGYRIIGTGPPLILIHGWPLFSYTWRFVIHDLSKRFTCFLLDMPGLGDSKWNKDTNFHWPYQAKRITGLITELKLDNISILAQDSGGAIARLVALDAKNDIQKLMLINTEVPNHRPPWVPLYRTLSMLPLSSYVFKALMSSNLFLRSSMGMRGLYHDKKLLDDPSYVTPYINPLINSSKRLKGAMKYLVGCDLKITDTFEKRHREINADVLLIWGVNDPTFPLEYGRGMANQFQNCTFVEIDDACLMPNEEKPREVLGHIERFLSVDLLVK